MFCEKCGKNLENNAKFCPYCGTVIAADAPRSAPAAEPVSASGGNTGASGFNLEPRRPRLPVWGKILTGAAAVALVAAVVAGLVVSGVFTSDKGKVSGAAVKTISAFAGAARDAGLPDLNDLTEGQTFSQSVEVALEKLDLGVYGLFFDTSALEGAGIRISTNYDLAGEELSASVTPFYGSADLLTAQLVMEGSRVYVNSPELLGKTCFGLDTETLGRDLRELGADEDIVGDLSFNIFQLMKKMRETPETNGGTRSAIADAVKELYEAVEVEKTGTETVRVNGGSVKCTAYTVVIPKSAMKSCIRAVRSAVGDSVDYRKNLTALLSSLGLPDELTDEIGDRLSGADPEQAARDLFSSLEDRVDDLGDVELQVYLSGGYIMAVTYSGRIGGTRVTVELNLGGGKNYVDDLSLSVSVKDSAETGIVLTSHGSHGAAGDTFTDETVLEITRYGDTFEVSSEIRYAPKKDRNNFSWSIDLDDVRIDMEGQLTAGKDSVELHLEELKFRVDNMSATLRVDCSIGSYQGIPSVNSPVMILTLDEDELQDLAEEISGSVSDWLQDLADEIPALENFIPGPRTNPSYPF